MGGPLTAAPSPAGPVQGPEAAAADLLDRVWAELPPDQRAWLAPVRDRLAGPLRVKLVGRVSTGKSTLVNALVGRRVAATDARDCTTVPTVYRHGSPERIVAVRTDGSEELYGFDFDARDAAESPDIHRFDAYLGSKMLRSMTLVDTPGLEATSVRPADGSQVEADVLLYLFRGALRTDDVAVVNDFIAACGELPQSSACVGLLSHADTYGDGAWSKTDPMAEARAAATRLHAALPGRFSTIVPVSALMAQSVRTGALTERDVHAVRSLRSLPLERVRFFEQLGAPAGVDAAAVRRVRSLVGEYGLRHGLAHSESAATWHSWLFETSGIETLERHLREELLPVVRRGRADRALRDLVRLVSRGGVDPRLGALVEHELSGALFQPVREYRAYKTLLRQHPASPLVPELAALMASGPTAASAAGETREELLARASYFQGQAALASRSADAEAARTISTSLAFRAAAAGRS